MAEIAFEIVAFAKRFGVSRYGLSTIIACLTAVLLTKFVAKYGVNLYYYDSVARRVARRSYSEALKTRLANLALLAKLIEHKSV